MKKIILTFLGLSASICLLHATHTEKNETSDKEKVVTNRWSIVTGEVIYANHYFTNQEYKGILLGVKGEHGAFYKKSDRLSWNMDLSFQMAPYSDVMAELSPSNPAGTTHVSFYNLLAEYGTFYNWSPSSNLHIKAGGTFEINGGVNLSKPNSINNILDLDFQPQFKVAAGVRYGWDFRKIGVHVYGDVAVPFMGFMLVSSQYQGNIGMIPSEILPSSIDHLVFSSFHNLSGYNMELGVDLIFKNCSLFISNEIWNRWWNAYGIQNYRKYNLTKIGFSVDLVSRSRLNSKNRYF